MTQPKRQKTDGQPAVRPRQTIRSLDGEAQASTVGWPFAIVSAVVINVRLRRQNERIHVRPTPPKKPRKNDIWIDTQT